MQAFRPTGTPLCTLAAMNRLTIGTSTVTNAVVGDLPVNGLVLMW
jgi:hypothetical protein